MELGSGDFDMNHFWVPPICISIWAPQQPDGHAREVLPYTSCIGTFRQSGYHFQARKASPFLPLRSHNFRWFRAPSVKCVKTQTYVPFLVFWWRPAWSSLEQGKKLQHFLLDRVAKFTYFFFSWTGSGFRWISRTPLLKFLLSTTPGIWTVR